MAVVGEGSVREVLVRFMACTVRVRSRGEGNRGVVVRIGGQNG